MFAEAQLTPHIVQYAEEKQTIVNLVAENLGAAIVPRWTTRISSRGVCFVPLQAPVSIGCRSDLRGPGAQVIPLWMRW